MAAKITHRWRLLGLVLIGFTLPAAVVVLLQLHPGTGVPLSYAFAPWWTGLFLHLMLLVIAVLALIGEVPRWALALPAAVWLGGLGAWWVERAAIRERVLRTTRLELPGNAQPLVLRFASTKFPPTTLAQALVSVYSIDSVYAGQFRYRVSTGKECSRDPDNVKVLRPYQPRYLVETEQCIVRERLDAPPGGIEVVVHSAPGDKRDLTTFKPFSTQIDIAMRGGEAKPLGQFDVRQEYATMPLLWPVVGCLHVDKKRDCRTELMRWPFPFDENPDRARANAPWLDNNAYYIAAALGLKPRSLTREVAATRDSKQ